MSDVPSILLVEEDPILREITTYRLELLGHCVVPLSSSDQAIDWLSEQTPKLIAIGCLADMASLEFLNRVRDDARSSETPILVLSPDSDLDVVQKAFNAGADEYLLVPYDPLVLENKVNNLIAASTTIK